LREYSRYWPEGSLRIIHDGSRGARGLVSRRGRETLSAAADSRCHPSDRDGEADFYLVAADFSFTRRNDKRGMSSLYQRDAAESATVVRVPTTRLDTFFQKKCSPRSRLGLWIDTEGKSFEVVQGTTGIARQTKVLHLEVETTPCIATGQKLYHEVKQQLERLGFSEVATDKSTDQPQINAVFVRDSWNLPFIVWMKTYLLRERLYDTVTSAIRRLQPGASRH
jgi:Methyltransferase FkbM domain